jgi:hypothetical protein
MLRILGRGGRARPRPQFYVCCSRERSFRILLPFAIFDLSSVDLWLERERNEVRIIPSSTLDNFVGRRGGYLPVDFCSLMITW